MVYAACRDIFQKNSLSWVEFWGSCVYYWSMTNRNDEIERLFKTHYARMHRLGVAILHDSDVARDVVHDVFASLLKAPDLLSGHRWLSSHGRPKQMSQPHPRLRHSLSHYGPLSARQRRIYRGEVA